MNDWQRRLLYALATAVTVVLVYAVGYQWAMATFESAPISYVQAVQFVVEAITTAGFGGHAPWSSSVLNVFVLLMNLTGVLFVFLAVPVFVVPLFREVFRTHPPARTRQSGHVLVCYYSPRGEAFAAQVASRGRACVFIEPDRERATALHEEGHDVIVGDPETTRALENANLAEAVGIVADATDDVNASIALSVRALDPEVRLITLVEDPSLEQYHRLAGADAVLSPRQLLGQSLARQVPTVTTRATGEGVVIGSHLELFELKIESGSELSHRTLREARLRERLGFDVLGAWQDGTFESPARAELRLQAGMRLLVAGPPGRIEALQQEAAAAVHRFSERTAVIAGYGRAGAAAAAVLAETGMRVTVLDREEKDQVDVVGDVRNPAVLEEAGIQEATAAIIAVDDDTTAIFATLVMRELNPSLYIIVRANKEKDEQKLYRAGADYVQSLATVSGRMMASTMLEDEEVLTLETQIEIARLPVGRLEGQTLAEANVRRRTGATVLAVVRNGEADPLTELRPESFRFAAGDEVLIAGTSESVLHFEATFCGEEAPQ